MKPSTLLALTLAIVAVIGTTLWYRFSDGEALLRERVASEHAKAGPSAVLSPDAVLSIRPERRLLPAMSSPRMALPPLTREVIEQRAYKPLYDRLAGKAERTGEEDWALATALRCAWTAESRKKNPRPTTAPKPLSLEERRAKFAAALPAKAANREQRLAAFDDAAVNPCEGFADVEISEKEITALLEQGAAKGDLKAKVTLIEQRWMQSMMAADARRGMPPLSDSDLATLKDIGAGPDPVAAGKAFQGMLRNYDNFSLRVADTDEPVDLGAMYAAMQLMACDYGLDCGPSSRQLRQACAMQGRCDISNLRDYTYYYNSSPASSQLVEQYADALQRARRSDWSYFSFFPGPTPSTATWR